MSINPIDTIGELLLEARGLLSGVSDTPDLDAAILLAHSLSVNTTYLATWPNRPIDIIQKKTFQTLLSRRLLGEPIAYILGEKAFWTFDLKVTPDVLIPRPDTECLVERLLALSNLPHNVNCLELGVGSGAITLALASERPSWQFWATDYSEAALLIAKENALRLGLLNIHWMQMDWFKQWPDVRVDVLVSNPPYIAESDAHLDNLSHEPRLALCSGPTGYESLTHIISQGKACLNPGGWMILEHGYDQADDLRACFEKNGFVEIQSHLDLGACFRVTMGQLPNG